MKFIVPIIFVCILFCSCHDTPSFDVSVGVYGPFSKLHPSNNIDSDATFSALKNGVHFTGNLKVINHNDICLNCFSIILMTFEDSVVLRDWLAFTNLHVLKKEFTLFPNIDHQSTIEDFGYDKVASTYYDTKIEDQHLDSYQLFDMADNWVRFQSIDTISGIIKGKFQAHYEKTWEQDPANPKFVKFSEGVFEFNYKE